MFTAYEWKPDELALIRKYDTDDCDCASELFLRDHASSNEPVFDCISDNISIIYLDDRIFMIASSDYETSNLHAMLGS